MNLTKEVKDLYSENYTTLKKEIKEDTHKWKHILCRCIGRPSHRDQTIKRNKRHPNWKRGSKSLLQMT